MSRVPRATVWRRKGQADVIVRDEHHEQVRVINWAEINRRTWPELEWLFAIPNGANKSGVARGAFKAEGLKAGVPDLCLPVRRRNYSALYIEMKRTRGGSVSTSQRRWIDALNAIGNRAIVAHGAEIAIHELRTYLTLPEQ